MEESRLFRWMSNHGMRVRIRLYSTIHPTTSVETIDHSPRRYFKFTLSLPRAKAFL